MSDHDLRPSVKALCARTADLADNAERLASAVESMMPYMNHLAAASARATCTNLRSTISLARYSKDECEKLLQEHP